VSRKTAAAAPLLPVDQQIREDAQLGAAWRRCEAALPVAESVVEGISWEKGKGGSRADVDRYHARAYRWDPARPWHRLYADGPTPTAALEALAERLEKLRDG
jgi:hypothetical protein